VNNSEIENLKEVQNYSKLIQFWKTRTANSSPYRLKENISLDESLTLWKGRRIKQSNPLLSSKEVF
jgi:hypothetical protein